jgi:hypothetical protein
MDEAAVLWIVVTAFSSFEDLPAVVGAFAASKLFWVMVSELFCEDEVLCDLSS